MIEPINYIVEDSESDPSKFVVYKNDKTGGMTVEQIFGRKDFVTKLEVDGNSNAVFTYKHGGGSGKIKIPHGGIYTLPILMSLLNIYPGSNMCDEHRIYKELIGTVYGGEK